MDSLFFTLNMRRLYKAFRKMNLTLTSQRNIILIITFLLSFSQTGAFNVDTQNVKVFSGKEGTHYGQTIKFDKKAAREGHLNLLIGAPKTETRFKTGHVHETGSLITCYDVLNDVQECRQEPEDNQFPDTINTNVYLDEKSHYDAGYGYGLSVSPGGTRLVCSPYWKDVKWIFQYGFTFMPGRCVAYIDRNGQTELEHLMPYFRIGGYVIKGEHYTGFAGFGLSADIHEDLVFAVGVPGLTIWEGAVSILDLRTESKMKEYATSKEYRNTHITKTAYGYLGYEVIFGKFCEPPTICFAAGAPNYQTLGVVKLYTWVNELIDNFQTISGNEPFAYFGSVLCAADTDGDAIDELLVGSPHYQTGTDVGYDIGKVYLYKRAPVSKFFHLLQEIPGPLSSWSRFGSAIQAIGDINMDSKFDLAIGAPGEEEGRGCVYIYLGYVGGGVVKDQRICASQIQYSPPIRGFGSSLSGAAYSDKTPYPVFAVGAFQTNKIVLFQSRPILDVEAIMSADPNRVDVDENCELFDTNGPCAVIKYCIKHHVRKSQLDQTEQESQKFLIDLKLDTKSKASGLKRAVFQEKTDQQVDTLQLSKNFNASGSCYSVYVVIRTENLERDRFTPIQVEMTYDLENNQRAGSTSSPVIDPTKDRRIYNTIIFDNDCGSDNICRVDLKAGQRLIYPSAEGSDSPFITLGHTKEITVMVTATNSGETCYWTEIKVKLDQALSMSRFNSDTIRDCHPIADVGTTIVCNYYQALAPNKRVGLTLTFDTENLANNRGDLSISTEVTAKDKTFNPENTPDDNKIQQDIDVFIVANISILGKALPEEMNVVGKGKKISPDVHNDIQEVPTRAEDVVNKVVLNHKFLVKNKGPSFLPETNLQLAVPVYIPDGTMLVTTASVKLISGDQVIDCSNPVNARTNKIQHSTTTAAPLTTESGIEMTTLENPFVFGEIVRRKRETGEAFEDNVDSSADDTTFTMSCQSTPEYCLMFTCRLPKVIPAGGHAELNVTLTLDRDNIPMPETFTSFRLELRTVLEEPVHKLWKPWKTNQRIAVTHTSFHLYESGGKVEPWIIAVSVLGGLILIVIIVVVCWKLGFFERKQHHQVKTWKRESIRSKRGSQKGGTVKES